MTFTPSEHIQTILRNLPMKPGVYLMKDDQGTIIYVGKAKKLRNRVRSYFNASAEDNPKTLRLRENIRLGHRVDGFSVDVWEDTHWREYAKGQSIGACRLFRGAKVKSDRVRLRITSASASPCVSDFGLFIMPSALDQK